MKMLKDEENGIMAGSPAVSHVVSTKIFFAKSGVIDSPPMGSGRFLWFVCSGWKKFLSREKL